MRLVALLYSRFILIISVWLISPQVVLAQAPVEIGQSVPKTGDYLSEILLSLVLVLGIIFFSAWLLRRFGKYPGVANGNLRVLGALSVGQRERILLLQVGEEQVLVGVTSSRITTLHQLESPIDTQNNPPAGKASADFKNSLQKSSFAQKLQEALVSMQPKSKNAKNSSTDEQASPTQSSFGARQDKKESE